MVDPSPDPGGRPAGVAAMSVTVAVWAGFALSLRAIHSSTATPGDVALLRYGIPIVGLAARARSVVRTGRRERPSTLVLLAAGAGLPYFLIASGGAAATSAPLVAFIVPGIPPLVLGLLGRRSGARGNAVALGCIAMGVVVVAVGAGSAQTLLGTMLLVGAGGCWTLYTVGLRRTVMHPLDATAWLCAPSLVLTLIGIATGVLPSNLLAGRIAVQDLLLFAVVQGVLVGTVAAATYAVAVRRLGAGTAAVAGASSPVVVTVASAVLLHETLSPVVLAGSLLLLAGVLLAGVPRLRRAPSVGR